METDTRSSRPQPFLTKTMVSNGYLSYNHPSTSERGLVHIPRSSGCILSHCDSSGAQMIPMLPNRYRPFPIQGPAVRSLIGSTGFLQDPACGDRISSSSTHNDLSIPRRLFNQSPIIAGSAQCYRDNTHAIPGAGSHSQCSKVIIGAAPNNTIHRCSSRLYDRACIITDGKVLDDAGFDPDLAHQSNGSHTTVPTAYGTHGLHNICSQTRKVTFSMPSTLDGTNLSPQCTRCPQDNNGSHPGQEITSLVDKSRQSIVGRTLSLPSAVGAVDNRCITHRMGRTPRPRTSTRPMVTRRIVDAHQLPEAQGSVQSMSTLPSHHSGTSHTSPYGQYDNRLLRKQAGWGQVPLLVRRSGTSMEHVQSPQHLFNRRISPGPPQCNGRRPQQAFFSQSRMGVTSHSALGDISTMGISASRPLCHFSQCEMSSVLLESGNWAKFKRRHFPIQLGMSPTIRISTHTPDSQGSGDNYSRKGHSNPNSPRLAHVVSIPPSHVDTSSVSSTNSARSALAKSPLPSPPQVDHLTLTAWYLVGSDSQKYYAHCQAHFTKQ
ncbi:uncharacterized protein LOC112547838 [Pelodiscus sinensis]|uniref:uncharacterized protein LOC112547838 n=1 Tax=Pelodiscus sinensis TaxID=13735 RepID=UPI003F6C0166